MNGEGSRKPTTVEEAIALREAAKKARRPHEPWHFCPLRECAEPCNFCWRAA